MKYLSSKAALTLDNRERTTRGWASEKSERRGCQDPDFGHCCQAQAIFVSASFSSGKFGGFTQKNAKIFKSYF